MKKELLLLLILCALSTLFGTVAIGYVTVTSSDGVKILVDGVYEGTVVDGNLLLPLSPGRHWITGQKEGYEDSSDYVNVIANRSTKIIIELGDPVGKEKISLDQKRITLGNKTGTINIFSIPFEATVSIDDIEYGETDIRLTNFPIGIHTLKMESANKILQISFVLCDNETLDFLADFVEGEISQLFTVSFDFPDGVEVTANGRNIQRNASIVLIGSDHLVEMKTSDSFIYEPLTVKHIIVTRNRSYDLKPDFSEEYKHYLSNLLPGKLVFVPRGTFIMGDIWGDGRQNERPLHEVTFFYDFLLGQFEVKFEEYDAFCEVTGWEKPNDRGWGRGQRPVINVDWNDAIAYCNWLSEKEKLPKAYDNNGNLLDKDGRITTDPSKVVGYRLPTEAEWEYAARGGMQNSPFKFSGSDDLDEIGWYYDNSFNPADAGRWVGPLTRITWPVGLKQPNELGIYDMSGNVSEWCSDSYYKYSNLAQTNPYIITSDFNDITRVYRGGNMESYNYNTRIPTRSYTFENSNYDWLGFRICITVPYEGENRSPLIPQNPNPSNSSINRFPEVGLVWDCVDPDGDHITYDVYLDTDNDPATIIATDLVDAALLTNNLLYGTTYYWKVVAKDSNGATTEGPIWKFVTQIELSSYSTFGTVSPMLLVKKGSFTMGDNRGYRDSFETLFHDVELKYDFYIGECEVTFNEYDLFCYLTERDKPYDRDWGRETRPVINVSWWDAIAYCNWLSDQENIQRAYDSEGNLLDETGNLTDDPANVVGYRLPTEAEWEYASRSGNKSKDYVFSGSENVSDVAWFDLNSNYQTHEVGMKAPNDLGFYDMSGNVWEWCSDWYDKEYYSKSPLINPYNSTHGSDRVIRGGSWGSTTTGLRVTDRSGGNPTRAYGDVGFRIARTVPYEEENRSPLAPYNPIPSDEVVVRATTVTLRWDSYDQDDDTMTYDVYFDTNATPTTKVSSSQMENASDRSDLSYGTTYYWKVVAKDSKGATTEGPVWKFTTQDLQTILVLVEKGSFTMGDTWGDGYSDEKPTHTVTFTYDFYIGKYETTFDEYDAFCNDTGRNKPNDWGWGRGTRPVINVSWWDAIAYCNWLSVENGLPVAYRIKGEVNEGELLDSSGNVTTDITEVVGYRLPTEAEWEYAARGAKHNSPYKYSGSDNVNDVAWYTANSGNKTQEVGKKAFNDLGLYDMTGNVYEWCSDWYSSAYYYNTPKTNPYNNSTTGPARVFRGGSCFNVATNARVAVRSNNPPYSSINVLGFRIARTLP